jgi:hypothetical protein
MSAHSLTPNNPMFRRARLLPHIRKAIDAPNDLLNLAAAYKGARAIAPEEFPSFRYFRKFIRERRYQQPEYQQEIL